MAKYLNPEVLKELDEYRKRIFADREDIYRKHKIDVLDVSAFPIKIPAALLGLPVEKKQEENTKLAPVSPSKHNSSKFYSLSFCNHLPPSLVEGISSPLPLQDRQVPFGCYTSHQEAMDSATYQQTQTKAAIDTHEHTKK